MLRNLLAAVLVVALPVILLMSNRDWVLSDQHRTVSHVADIPAQASGELIADLDRIVAYYGVHVPRKPTKAEQLYRLLVAMGKAPPARVRNDYQRPRYGYAVREWTFLGMPFGWISEPGYSVYTRDRWELVFAPLVPEADAELRKEAGRDLRAGFFFPFWAHSWGWLYVALLALWGWLVHRNNVRRREAEGMI